MLKSQSIHQSLTHERRQDMTLQWEGEYRADQWKYLCKYCKQYKCETYRRFSFFELNFFQQDVFNLNELKPAASGEANQAHYGRSASAMIIYLFTFINSLDFYIAYNK